MANRFSLTVNGSNRQVSASPDTPLLYVLRNDLKLQGPRFGCGLAQCGACTVHIAGEPVRSCVTPIGSVAGKRVTTLEGLARKTKDGTALHAVQQAFIDEQATQCGYCLNGWIMTAAALLDKNPRVSDADIRAGLAGLKCRCGAHMRMLRAVQRAAKTLSA